MPAIYDRIARQLRHDVLQACHHIGIAASVEVGTADAHSEQCVTCEGNMFCLAVENNTTGRMPGCLEDGQRVVAKPDLFSFIKESANGRKGASQWGSYDVVELLGQVADEKVVCSRDLHFQPIFLENGVDAEVMVEVTVSGKQVNRL